MTEGMRSWMLAAEIEVENASGSPRSWTRWLGRRTSGPPGQPSRKRMEGWISACVTTSDIKLHLIHDYQTCFSTLNVWCFVWCFSADSLVHLIVLGCFSPENARWSTGLNTRKPASLCPRPQRRSRGTCTLTAKRETVEALVRTGGWRDCWVTRWEKKDADFWFQYILNLFLCPVREFSCSWL